MNIDLHTHTNCSDGILSPEALIDRAIERELTMLAITDHDTCVGLPIARKHLAEQSHNLELVPGVEISTQWQNKEIHVVGLWVDSEATALAQGLKTQQQKRRIRAERIAEKLSECGIKEALAGAEALANTPYLNRSHFARYLVAAKYSKNFQQAIKDYLKQGGKAYVASEWVSVAEAVHWIQQAKGIAVLAHPHRYQLSNNKLRRLLTEFKAEGGAGLEIIFSQQKQGDRDKLLQWCQEYNFYASIGSDFHQPQKWSDLGLNLKMPEGCHTVLDWLALG